MTFLWENLAFLQPRFRRSGDPYLLLRAVLPRESVLLDPAMQVHVRFRLGGPRQGSKYGWTEGILKDFKGFFGVQQKQRFVKKTSCLQERSSIEGRLQTFVYLVARFPPTIFYKIYTHGNVVDLGSFAPREYHLERLSQEQGNILPGSTIVGWGFQ